MGATRMQPESAYTIDPALWSLVSVRRLGENNQCRQCRGLLVCGPGRTEATSLCVNPFLHLRRSSAKSRRGPRVEFALADTGDHNLHGFAGFAEGPAKEFTFGSVDHRM